MQVLNGVGVEKDSAKQASRKQKHVGESNASFRRRVKLLLEADRPEDVDQVGAREEDHKWLF